MPEFNEIPVGTKYNKLSILREVEMQYHANGKAKRMVEVLCDCGVVSIKHYADVKHGQTKTCGTCPRESVNIDLTGLVVNRLTVMNISRKGGGYTYWDCKCQCGNNVEVEGRRLRTGRVHNCGICGTKLGAYYVGDNLTNNEGHTAEVVIIHDKKLGVVFPEDKSTIVEIKYGNISTGGFANPFARSVFGEGYFGVGKFIAKSDGVHAQEYVDWHSMLRRCYDDSEYHKIYEDVEVFEPWKCYQTFAAWAVTQVGFSNKSWCLEKDLLVKHNKLYGPETCIYLPTEINAFIKRKRQNDLPLGIDLTFSYSGASLYRVQSREGGKNVCLGHYSNSEDAFCVYKSHKESLAKKLADKWKGSIDPRAYEALMAYNVEITD